jgi:hypothetical protein
LDYTGLDLSGLSSYRSQFTMKWSGTDDSGKAVEGSFTVTAEYTTDPPASHTFWEGTATGTETGAGKFEMLQIGGTSYIISSETGTEGQCVSFSSDSMPDQTPLFTPDSFLSGSDLSKAQRIQPDETVNGMLTRHFRATQNDVQLTGGLSNYTVDVWVAADGGYPVRSTMVADGNLATLGTGNGHIEWTYDLLDVNSAVTIELPAGCEEPAGGDFPKMPDAAGSTSFGKITTYTTASSIADVVAFYQAQLPPLGWVAGTASTDTPGFATLEFTRGDEKVTVTITESDGKTTVLISFE